MPCVYIKTYGCQMNERDSEAVAAQLVAKGYWLAASEADADVILLNTCSVRDLCQQSHLQARGNASWNPPRAVPGRGHFIPRTKLRPGVTAVASLRKPGGRRRFETARAAGLLFLRRVPPLLP
jgi:hypothetical protein